MLIKQILCNWFYANVIKEYIFCISMWVRVEFHLNANLLPVSST